MEIRRPVLCWFGSQDSESGITAPVTEWLEYPPSNWQIVGLLPVRAKPKTLKLEQDLFFTWHSAFKGLNLD